MDWWDHPFKGMHRLWIQVVGGRELTMGIVTQEYRYQRKLVAALSSGDKLPKLQEFGLAGNSYESLVRNALARNRPLATYLAWILARNCLL